MYCTSCGHRAHGGGPLLSDLRSCGQLCTPRFPGRSRGIGTASPWHRGQAIDRHAAHPLRDQASGQR